ncbi:metal-dependent hydrolase [Consotaella aegiceratis]|uniref:metal-dependent hydrolase n=1 Tax=Consotaella aegiceratis TaxID=3097961 RepID=UPI002F4154DB
MFIAHLPAGYLLTDRMAEGRRQRRSLMAVGLVAAVLPDLDLSWFYLVNERRTAHHAFVFHWPLFWVALALVSWLIPKAMRWRGSGLFIAVALANLLLHMVLDSVAAEIAWRQPFSDRELNLVEVPARYDWWAWNFVLHWTFALELAITGWAAITVWCNHRHAQVVRTTP